MTTNNLSAPHFHDPDKARELIESELWPDDPICPHCGVLGGHYPLKGETTRPGLYKCKDCRKTFSVTVGTLFERSKIPLNKWLMATYLLASSKKGYSARQLHRTIGVSYKTAWFMAHRLREAMREPAYKGKLGNNGGTVEVDETYWGNKGKQRKGARGYAHKEKIVSLVERGGKVRSHHVKAVNSETLRPILKEHIAKDAKLMTDEAAIYQSIGKDFASHDYVTHSLDEYVRGDVHTQVVENYFSILKRGLTGVYQHCSKQHLKRYICEYDFRYNNRAKLGIDDTARTLAALQGITGKRLTYRPTGEM
jgi:transposase-like protein